MPFGKKKVADQEVDFHFIYREAIEGTPVGSGSARLVAKRNLAPCTDVSDGHSYPLLNELKLAGRIDGKIPNEIRIRLRLPKAEPFLEAQVADQPPSCAVVLVRSLRSAAVCQ